MPNPNPGEDRDDFLDRCIPEVIGEGYEPDQAVAICISYFEGEKDKAFNVQQGSEIEYWKAFDRRRQSFEARFTKVMYNAIREQLKPLASATNVNELRVDLKDEPIKQAFVKLYSEVGDTFARITYSGLKGHKYIETKQVPQWIARMAKYALIDASARIIGITKFTQDTVNRLIVLGLQEQMSIGQIQDMIIGTPGLPPLNGTLEQRARRIARTEIISASNAGSLEGALSTGLEFKKQWLSTPDDRTRDDHIEAGGQTVGKREPFRVGGEELDYPGDPRGSAGNVINCRCTQIYLTEEI